MVPTDVAEVKLMLRRLEQPITLYGERPVCPTALVDPEINTAQSISETSPIVIVLHSVNRLLKTPFADSSSISQHFYLLVDTIDIIP